MPISKSRIPKYEGRGEILSWLSGMAAAQLLFHPDDDPATILTDDGEKLFTKVEIRQLRAQIPRIKEHWGDDIYEAMMAYGWLPHT